MLHCVSTEWTALLSSTRFLSLRGWVRLSEALAVVPTLIAETFEHVAAVS